MIVELINTGTELMLGRVLNTHQQWLCRQMADLDWVVSRQVAVADTAQQIEQAAREALGRADLVIVTGGLGPTSDDLTRERIAAMLGRGLHEDQAVLAHIQHFFDLRKRPMLPGIRVQAMVPNDAQVLWNPHGTAPGLAMELRPNAFRGNGKASWLVMLPGPPRELRPMFIDSVVPLVHKAFPAANPFVCKTFRTTGMGESLVENTVAGPLQALVEAGLELGYCARPGQTDVRLVARGVDAERVVREAEQIVRAKLGKHLFGVEEEELETVIVRLLTERKETLALAESCTGGLLAHRITNVPGASAVLVGGCVTYSNEAKQKFVGVKAETLDQHGAVSEPVAREMAEGVREKTGADYALSVTGIAGPAGGTESKPVGTVFIGLAGPFRTIVVRNFNPVDRETFKQMTAQQAMELLRRKVLDKKTPAGELRASRVRKN
jgi:nicotinamide-nucleotide amidase